VDFFRINFRENVVLVLPEEDRHKQQTAAVFSEYVNYETRKVGNQKSRRDGLGRGEVRHADAERTLKKMIQCKLAH
jgi:hypothetical protein